MKKITVSAPGKLMLFGEHAVVYNHPCLVTAVDQRMHLTVEILDKPDFQLEALDVKVTEYKKPLKQMGIGDIPKGAKFVEIAVKNFLNVIARTPIKSGDLPAGRHGAAIPSGIKITTRSEFSSQFGFGSSSTSTVCAIKALSVLFKIKLTNKEIFELAYKTVLDIQGKGSGFDVAAAVYGGTLYFVTAGKTIKPLNIDNLPLIVGYSGIKADTVTLINQVKEKFADKNDRLQKIYNEIEDLVENAKPEIISNNWDKVGKLMTDNQKLLVELGVSIPKLNSMISGAKKAGAYGAKLSGAGGGDCMIAFAPEEKIKSVEKTITQAGGEIISIKANAEGVRIENNMKSTAVAPSNIAFIKYWGKKDQILRLPENGSISMCLSDLLTTTTVEFDPKYKEDTIIINGTQEPNEGNRAIIHLDRVRSLAKIKHKAKIITTNNFPSGTGLSSSASGFAALTLAASSAAGLKLSEKELSILARQGSGSACRSIPSGFVEWLDGETSDTSYAKTLFKPDYWQIADVVAVVSKNKKEVATTEGQKLADSSPFFAVRKSRMLEKIKLIKKYIKEKNFTRFGEIVEAEALELHSIMLTSTPSLIYLLPASLKIMHLVKRWRSEGLEVYFTVNTGQDIHLICLQKDIKKLTENLSQIPEVQKTIINLPAIGARLTTNHLF